MATYDAEDLVAFQDLRSPFTGSPAWDQL